jgi:L-fucose isomerase-like protein
MHDHATSAQDLAASLATDTLNPMIEAVDSYAAMNKLIVDFLQHAPAILNNINLIHVSAAHITTFDVVDVASAARKCLLTIYASKPAHTLVCTVQISEIDEESSMHQPEGNHANHMSAQDCSIEQAWRKQTTLMKLGITNASMIMTHQMKPWITCTMINLRIQWNVMHTLLLSVNMWNQKM